MYDLLTVFLQVKTSHGRNLARLIVGLLLGLLYPLSLGAAGGEDERPVPSALQNPVLRSHYRSLFLSVYRGEAFSKNSRTSSSFIDNQIEHLLVRVDRKLEILHDSLDELTALRNQVVEGREVDAEVRTRWKQSTRQITQSSDDLHEMLSAIFLQLRRSDGFVARISENAGNIFYEKEIRYLTRQGESAALLIRSYLFSPAATIHFSDLRYTNMLILLHHARLMARALNRQLS